MTKAHKTPLYHEKTASHQLDSAPTLKRRVDSTRTTAKQKPVAFINGMMKITYTKELVNANLSYLLKLTVHGRVYSFKADENRRLQNDTVIRYTDTFELALEKKISENLAKDDFREAKCDLYIFKNNQPEAELITRLEVIITFYFTDKRGLSFNRTNIHFH